MNERCKKCGRSLISDELGLNKKMISRCAEEFYCISCLAEHFRVTEEQLEKQIEIYRSQGCMLFN